MIHFKWIYCQCDKPTGTQYCYGKKRLKRYMFFNSNTPWTPKASKKIFITNCIYSPACPKDNGPTMRIYKKWLRYYFCICKAQEVTLWNIWIAHIFNRRNLQVMPRQYHGYHSDIQNLGFIIHSEKSILYQYKFVSDW